MKPRNQALKYGAAAGLAAMATPALAALPPEIGTAITAATTDGTELGYLLLGLAVTVGVIFWLKRKA